MLENQIPGHLYGPPAPHIIFMNGDTFLGEVRAHPTELDRAHGVLRDRTEMLYSANRDSWRSRMLAHGYRTILACGPIYIPMGQYLHQQRECRA
ncbi:hypothetical protein [Comamonas thiooxydans]|uniref:hypothetical protein n=1 Tax=Comamonas thiooxydans TaxID=363952 RepID=UPI000B40E121|nr:hypothetical protein [Comamonas thiooxydans]